MNWTCNKCRIAQVKVNRILEGSGLDQFKGVRSEKHSCAEAVQVLVSSSSNSSDVLLNFCYIIDFDFERFQ